MHGTWIALLGMGHPSRQSVHKIGNGCPCLLGLCPGLRFCVTNGGASITEEVRGILAKLTIPSGARLKIDPSEVAKVVDVCVGAVEHEGNGFEETVMQMATDFNRRAVV